MEARHLLKDFKLKTTTCRQEVLDLMLTNEHALSHSDIEREVDPAIDRVTVYRTLRTFLDKGLIHKVLDDGGVTKYALCHDCSAEEHHHDHVHFKCNSCGQTICLDKIKIPVISLPKGFRAQEKNLLIQGICDSCANA